MSKSVNMKSYLLFFIFLLLFSVTLITNASGLWVTETVDSAGDVGLFTSIAVDSNNKAHISYSQYRWMPPVGASFDLRYATDASGSWVTETVDSGYVGWFTSVTTDSNNSVHISYLAPTNYVIKYATNASGSWDTQTVDNVQYLPELSSEYTSIAMDSYNKVHISYVDVFGLKYATNFYSPDSWFIQTVDSTGGMGSSIAISSHVFPMHISYFAYNGDLKYATNASGSWVTQTVDSAVYVILQFTSIENTSIATDSNNKVHISYYDATNGDLKYATNTSGSWVIQTVDSAGNVGGYTSIAVDSNNKVHISYYDATNGDLKYATNTSGSWVTQTVDSEGDVGINTSIATDSNNKVHISYYDATNGDLKYATNDVPDIACSFTPDGTQLTKGGTLKFWVGAQNNDAATQAFKFATKVKLPNGNMYPASGYLVGPISVTLTPGQSKSKYLTQVIPLTAPLGTYTYYGYVGTAGPPVIKYNECQFTFSVVQ
jgi:hypothetical protein